jgi:5-hydroxyisourate hydrolase
VSSLSTHVLDSATGRPAEGMDVRLESRTPTGWVRRGQGRTDADGRVREWVEAAAGRNDAEDAADERGGSLDGDSTQLEPGHHRLIFDTAAWFADRDRECFYPEVCITFAVPSSEGAGHYHVPLLLAPYAYSTYRGS